MGISQLKRNFFPYFSNTLKSTDPNIKNPTGQLHTDPKKKTGYSFSELGSSQRPAT